MEVDLTQPPKFGLHDSSKNIEEVGEEELEKGGEEEVGTQEVKAFMQESNTMIQIQGQFAWTEETGKEVSRVQMWDITHKKIDGSYVNEKAKEIAGLDQESEIPSPKELGSRSSGARNKEA
ncbi:hypothetical protein Ahy_A07g034963 [Arachis hypogaea]|uniref:Uncharacterized protein n=1 Tax=Arachis hypogaea TaxID=3818 RepID=A0A445CD53_ARAHY|nr:hypothetical protein Ahy_A07g034963 [Arachis hypogaea]